MLTLKSTFLPLSNFLFYLYSTKGSSIHNNIYVVYCDALKIGFYVELPKNGFYMISKLKFYSLTTTNLKIN